jgi:hypothetical protein
MLTGFSNTAAAVKFKKGFPLSVGKLHVSRSFRDSPLYSLECLCILIRSWRFLHTNVINQRPRSCLDANDIWFGDTERSSNKPKVI